MLGKTANRRGWAARGGGGGARPLGILQATQTMIKTPSGLEYFSDLYAKLFDPKHDPYDYIGLSNNL